MAASTGRKPLAVWLEEMVISGSIPRLEWHHQAKREIQIPWKSRKSSLWEPSDDQIFREYALSTRMYRQNSDDKENDPCYWKGLLRSALRQCPDLKEIKDSHKLKCKNPYRVYRLLNSKESKKNKSKNKSSSNKSSFTPDSMPFSMTGSSSASGFNYTREVLLIDEENPNLALNLEGNLRNAEETAMHKIPTVVYEESQDMKLKDGNFQSGSGNDASISRSVILQNTFNAKSNNLSLHSSYCDNEQGGNVNNINFISPDVEKTSNSDLLSSDSNFDLRETENISIDIQLPSLDNFSECTLQMEVFFKDHCILTESFDEQGARLFCGDLSTQRRHQTNFGDETTYGPSNRNQFCMPYVDKMTPDLPISIKQKQLIRTIQNHINRGLLVRATKSYVFAQRLCKARVIFCNQDGQCKKMSRANMEETVFDVSYFIQQLKMYMADSGSQIRPSPTIMFSFGQNFESDVNNSKHGLIYAKFTHLEAERMLIQALEQKCNSEALISNSIPEDNLAYLLEMQASI